ncbi:MAG: hypothetical protein NTW72_03800 [Gemmatimonadetes bacterium]|nr:hypothetical protein [Gemmatimonadota bacterium]
MMLRHATTMLASGLLFAAACAGGTKAPAADTSVAAAPAPAAAMPAADSTKPAADTSVKTTAPSVAPAAAKPTDAKAAAPGDYDRAIKPKFTIDEKTGKVTPIKRP